MAVAGPAILGPLTGPPKCSALPVSRRSCRDRRPLLVPHSFEAPHDVGT
jgi:hypothetical protein